jgi:ribosomal protein S18 acetylase RimI-like enzyme
VEPREDSWLSERFGHPVFSVDAAEGLAEHAAAQGTATYQARVPVEDVESVDALVRAGMRVVNVSVTLRADPSAAAPAATAGFEVGDAAPEHGDALLAVAGRCFTHSRFHLDPDVPPEAADRIKRDWVSSYLAGSRGEELLVAGRDGEAVGFLAVLARDGVRVIDLIGVAPEAQGSGAGTALVAAFHKRSAGRCDAVEVGTQLANAPAMAFYERLGYVTVRSAFDLHMHVR